MDIYEYNSTINAHTRISRYVRFVFFLCVPVCVVFGTYRIINTPPADFPVHTEIVIEEGSTINSITEQFAHLNVVRSGLYLYVLLLHGHRDAVVQAGTYSFDTPLSPREIADVLIAGTGKKPLVSITLPEGFQARDIATYLGNDFPTITPDALLPYEGYLFPDTYFVSPQSTVDDIRILLTSTAEERLAPYKDAIAQSGFTEREVIILASILEREAKDVASKRAVSGILQNRLKQSMPLQVDATFDYILGKTSAELTLDDLEIDSPYNTYNHTGLPPTPIANPGIESIEAVLNPTPSDFLYYLTEADGTFHYARTFEEHKQNKAQYLR